MPGEFFFMALGGLGVSLAGFAGLIAAFGRSKSDPDPVQAWRIANIVIGGAVLTLTGFGTIAVYLVVDEPTLTVRIASGLLTLFTLLRGISLLGARPAWEGYERRRRLYTIGFVLLTAATAVNVSVASVGLLGVLMVINLFDVFGIFMNAVADFSSGMFAAEPREPDRSE